MEINTIENVSGLYYIPNAIISGDIIAKLDEKQWTPLTTSANSRMVQHYGYTYDYKTYKINTPTMDIPDFLSGLKTILTKICCEDLKITDCQYEFNQCIVNNYQKGQGISKHIDVKSFGPVIGCFTLGSGATMKFANPKTTEIHSIYVEPNSLYIMSLDARYIWTHEMPATKYDGTGGDKIERGRRISITFRNVPFP